MSKHLLLFILFAMSGYWTGAYSGQTRYPEPLESGRIELVRPINQLDEQGDPYTRREHPVMSMFPERETTPEQYRSDNYDRLLVLLVDFQEDDNPKTTGNGKFVLEPDPDYPISLGAPPRDYDYFLHHLEAMRYYYLAASLGSYDLKYDIYPQRDSPFFAYTLPNETAYYNPGFADPELFIERVEEYFQDIFAVADSYGNIDFSQYGHFMFIHAGSSWQHDVYGDTPHDLPSYFVTVAEGKEAIVNDGTVKISSAANVPETISQDDRYGVINSVMAHEFGHSLGYVDLYNVNNSYPGVGWWDIMDSGGSMRVLMPADDDDDELVALEGVVPALPSAWHRLLSFGDYYKEQGYYREITDFQQDERIQLAAAGHKPDIDDDTPYIIRVPLDHNEYVLLENRNIDPDGQGGIAIRGAYPLTPGGNDYRVALHPIALDDDDLFEPTYEYDWLLPGWIDRRGYSYGGGIIVWHIDENVLFNQGVTYEDGTFRNNYENNTVNTNYNDRGIRIIEADDILDIGNPYSWFWRGTEYEPYFRYLPELDDDGFFTGWSPSEHNRELSALSEPALTSKKGSASLYSIYDISAVAKKMSFRYRFQPFEITHRLAEVMEVKAIASPGISILDDIDLVLPVFTDDGLYLYRQYYQDDQWIEFYHDNVQVPTQDVITLRDEFNRPVFCFPSGEKMFFMVDEGFSIIIDEIDLGFRIADTPVIISDNLLLVPTEEELAMIKVQDRKVVQSLSIAEANLSFDGQTLYALSDGYIYQYEIDDTGFLQPLNSTRRAISSRQSTPRNSYSYSREGGPKDRISAEGVKFSRYDARYSPAAYRDEKNNAFDRLLIQDDQGDIYSFTTDFKLLFSLSSYTDKMPTQLSLFQRKESGEVIVFFAAEDHLFAFDIEGAKISGFPKHIQGKEFMAGSYPRIIKNEFGEMIAIVETTDKGYYAYNIDSQKPVPQLSMLWDRTESNDLIFWEESLAELMFFFADRNNNLYQSVWYDNISTNPIVWNGARHNGRSSLQGIHRPQDDLFLEMQAYAYPNPVSGDQVRLRIKGAGNEARVMLFDIAGRIVYEDEIQGISGSSHEELINIQSLSSGMYYGKVKSSGQSIRFNIALEK